MKGEIEVTGLVLFARHGVNEAEEKLGQRFFLDLVLELDVAECVRSDKLADTVDYGEVVAVAEAAFRARRFYLIEAVAAHVASSILAHFQRATSVRVTEIGRASCRERV